MATIVTRSGKGSSLTNNEVDANFTNLNTAKLELGGGTITGTVVFNSAPTFNTAITMGSSLNVASSIGISGNTVIDASRNIIATSLDISGNIDVDGVTNLDATNVVGQLAVTGGISSTTRTNINLAADVGVLSATTLENGSALGLSITVPTSNIAAGDGVGIALGIVGRGRSYIANKNTSTNADASNLSFWTENGGVIGERFVIDSSGAATFNSSVTTGGIIDSIGTHRMQLRSDDAVPELRSLTANGSAFKSLGLNGLDLRFFTSSAERMRIDSSGRLLVGQTTNYSAAGGGTTKGVFTHSADSRTDLIVSNQQNGSNAGAALVLGSHGHDYIIEAQSAAQGSALTFTKSTEERMRIDSSGITTFTKSGGGNIRIAETASRYVEIMGYAEGSANGSTMAFHTTQTGTSTSTERMRIDSSGNVLVGTTSTGINASSSVKGHNFFENGYVVHARSGQTVMSLNRQTNDGTILDLRSGGTVVGSIGSSNGGERLYVVNDSTGLSFLGDFSKILPCDSAGAPRDAAIDLGQASGGRFKDLHLSGTAIAASFATTAGGTLTTAAGNDLNLVFPANRSLFIKEGSATHLTINNAGNVGIGVAPTFSAGGSRRLLQLTNGASGGLVAMGNNASESENPRIFSDADNLGFATSTTGGGIFQFFTANTERMRIDSSGNVLVSKTSSALSAAGIALMSNDQVRVTTSGDNPLELNRLSNDGDIIRFYKANTQVGSIGNVSNNLEVNSQGGTLKISTIGTERYGFDVEQFYPAVDGTTNLGIGNLRFDDVFLSGGVHLGGTGTANKLDSYEEGTWDPEIYYQNSTDLGNATNTTQTGYYTKIGRLVILDFRLIWNITGSIANDNIGVKNLPFVGDSDTFSTAGVGYARNNSTTINTLIIIRPADGGTLALCDSGDQIGNLGNEFGAGNAKEIRATLTYFTDA